MKILYAAGNHIGSNIQFDRFSAALNNTHTIKSSAYSSNSNWMDYTLDSLDWQDTIQSNISFNGNFYFYLNEIKRYAPDLIISDFDIYTSIIAIELGIKLWNYSSILFYYAINSQLKYNLKIHQKYSALIDHSDKKNGYVKHVINNADANFIHSHLCELDIEIDNKFQWSRPLCNLSKSDGYAISNGSSCSLADNFYNRKYSYHNLKHDDISSVIGVLSNEFFDLGKRNGEFGQKTINFEKKAGVKNICEHLKTL